MKRKTNRILSLLLAFVMAFCLVPTAAAATVCTHDWGEWETTIEATCTTVGTRQRICKICKEAEIKGIDALGHKYTTTVTKEASCEGAGVKTSVCSREDCTDTKTIPIPPTGHNYNKFADDGNGATHTATCANCKKPTTLAHDFGINNTAATCSDCGARNPNVAVVTTIEVYPTTTNLQIGQATRLTATTSPANLSVSWSSDNPSIAKVDNSGVVTGVAAGTTYIRATNGDKTATCTVTVKAASTSTTTSGVTHPSSIYLNAGGVSQPVTLRLDNAAYYDDYYVDWSISNYSNAAVYLNKTNASSSNSDWVTSKNRDTFDSRYGEATIYVRSFSSSSNSSATLTATVYYRDDSYYRPITISIPITVGYTDNYGYTLTPDSGTPSANSTVYLYDDYRYDYPSWTSGYRYYQDFSVTPKLDGRSILSDANYNITYTWKVNDTVQNSSSSSYKNYFTLRADNYSLNRSKNTLTCTARIHDTRTNTTVDRSISWNIVTDYYQTSSFTVSATVYDTTSRYNLNDKDDKNGSSIISQISDKLYSSSYSRDYISYVRFSNVSSSYGSLDASTSRDYYYESSRSGYYDLRDVEFTPSKTGTASFDCTVYTTRGYSYKCTINIKVEAGTTDKTASTINYSTKGTKSVTLSASDFTSRYKDVVGSSASTLTIKFRNVPSNGTLKYNSTTLTSSNIGNYEFSSSSSASYRISDVTYTPKNNSNSTDTIDYYCYSGSTRRFSGSIKFTNTAETVTVPSGVTVSYSTTGASVTFSAPDFYNKHSAMLSASYIVFGSPTSGTLSSGGSAVASGTKFGYTVDTAKGYKNLASVSYKPASGYSGTATIPFTAYNSDGTQAATGNVSILVSQTTTTTPTTPTNTAKTFKDVASTAWYANDVAALSAAGIVSGDNNGNFRPQDAVTYGEALKMVMIASGYPKQNELTGANWAQNYLTQAISNSILSGSASDYTLSKSINRTAMATVAAKALKLTPVTNAASSPYTDTSDSYVLALTNAGIVQGDASSGQTKWRGGDTLTRAEMSRIVYNIYKYRNVAPGGSSTSTDTSSKPDWLK